MDAFESERIIFVISVVGTIASVASFLYTKFDCPKPSNKLVKFIFGIWGKITLVFLSAILIFVSYSLLFYDSGSKPPTPTEVPTATMNLSNRRKVNLVDIERCIPNKESFRLNRWDDFTEIVVDDKVQENSIGIRVFPEIQSNNGLKLASSRIETSEFVEYNLRKQYDAIVFSIGIDKLSFEDCDDRGPACFCSITLESVDSCKDTKDSATLLYYSELFDYRFSASDIPVDLSNVETLRITAFWEYDFSSTRQNCMKLAIINPVLFEKNSD
jgi:hypothetical protein